MKIGVLGGSFDPPHIGHYFVIQQILELRLDIDKIILVPTFKHQWKPSFASVEDRINMLKFFVSGSLFFCHPDQSGEAGAWKDLSQQPLDERDSSTSSVSRRTSLGMTIMTQSFHVQNRVEISDVEIQRKGISYTIDTIKELKSQPFDNASGKKAKIYWIVGSDILYEFDKWDRKEELVKEATFLVFPRDPYHLPKKIPYGFECIQNKHLITTNISSTIIRERMKNRLPITNLVPKGVERYIIKHKIYR